MNIYEELAQWIQENYTPISTDWLYFNANRMEAGSNSINSIPGTKTTSSYLDGSSENEIPFAIAFIRLYSAEMSDDNLVAIAEMQSIAEWINSQTTFPDFGTDKIVHSIDLTQDIPDILVDQDLGLCKYQITGNINYLQQA